MDLSKKREVRDIVKLPQVVEAQEITEKRLDRIQQETNALMESRKHVTIDITESDTNQHISTTGPSGSDIVDIDPLNLEELMDTSPPDPLLKTL